MDVLASRGVLMTTLVFSGRVRGTRYHISAGAYAPVAPALTAALILKDKFYGDKLTVIFCEIDNSDV